GHMDARVTAMVDLYTDPHIELPDGAAYELQDLALHLGSLPAETEAAAAQTGLLWHETGRILARKTGGRGTQKLSDRIQMDFRLYLEQIAAEAPGLGDTPPSPLARLADELIVAREFARATLLAAPRQKELIHADLDH
ncbi:MAG TPA: hypothetical protein VKY74_06285, partial [Chloroflexia bacterium]|nr:hypothetical protein [Chloroflexia bacterium]